MCIRKVVILIAFERSVCLSISCYYMRVCVCLSFSLSLFLYLCMFISASLFSFIVLRAGTLLL